MRILVSKHAYKMKKCFGKYPKALFSFNVNLGNDYLTNNNSLYFGKGQTASSTIPSNAST